MSAPSITHAPEYAKVRAFVRDMSGLDGKKVLHYHYTGDLPEDLYCIVGAPSVEFDGASNRHLDKAPNFRRKVSVPATFLYTVMFYNAGAAQKAYETAIAMDNVAPDWSFATTYAFKEWSVGRVVNTSEPPLEGQVTQEQAEFDFELWDFVDYVQAVDQVGRAPVSMGSRTFTTQRG